MKNKIMNFFQKKLLVSRIQTPDGTILTSYYRHNYVQHYDKNNKIYFLDGGKDYQIYSIYDDFPAKNVSIYTNSKFKEIRKYYSRGTRGINSKEQFKYVPLYQMSNKWLFNCIKYNINKKIGLFIQSNYYYTRELIYRFFHNIYIY